MGSKLRLAQAEQGGVGGGAGQRLDTIAEAMRRLCEQDSCVDAYRRTDSCVEIRVYRFVCGCIQTIQIHILIRVWMHTDDTQTIHTTTTAVCVCKCIRTTAVCVCASAFVRACMGAWARECKDAVITPSRSKPADGTPVKPRSCGRWWETAMRFFMLASITSSSLTSP